MKTLILSDYEMELLLEIVVSSHYPLNEKETETRQELREKIKECLK